MESPYQLIHLIPFGVNPATQSKKEVRIVLRTKQKRGFIIVFGPESRK